MSEQNENNIQQPQKDANKKNVSTKKILGLAFGIFMVFIYVGMGILILKNFFWTQENPMDWMRWVIGPILIVYGFFRGWRQYKIFTREDEF